MAWELTFDECDVSGGPRHEGNARRPSVLQSDDDGVPATGAFLGEDGERMQQRFLWQ